MSLLILAKALSLALDDGEAWFPPPPSRGGARARSFSTICALFPFVLAVFDSSRVVTRVSDAFGFRFPSVFSAYSFNLYLLFYLIC